MSEGGSCLEPWLDILYALGRKIRCSPYVALNLELLIFVIMLFDMSMWRATSMWVRKGE